MGLMKKWSRIICIVIITSLIEDSHAACVISGGKSKTLLLAGDIFYVECSCDKSTKNVKWLDPGDSVIETADFRNGEWATKRVYTSKQGNDISLTINKASRTIKGVYKCIFMEPNGKEYVIKYGIDVVEPVTQPNCKTEQYLINGQDSIIYCSTNKEFNKNDTWWFKNEVDLSGNPKYEYRREGLVVKNASKEDEGTYRYLMSMVSKSESDSIDIDAFINVKLRRPPVIESLTASPHNVVKEGEPLVLDCYASGDPIPTYFWRKLPDLNTTSHNTLAENNSTKVPNPAPAVLRINDKQQEIGKLAFASVSMDDHGTYECVAQNGLGINATKTISIEVLVAPKIIDFEDVTVEEGSTVSVTCEAIGRPQPYIIVSGPESIGMPPREDYNVSDRTLLNLTFEKVHRSLEGQYECNATNKVGLAEASMYITVLYKPSFEVADEVVWTWAGIPVNLTCDYEAQPKASVKWSFLSSAYPAPPNPLYPTDKIKLEQIYNLTAKLQSETKDFVTLNPDGDLTEVLFGIYECIAKNDLGEAKKIFRLKEGNIPAQLTDDQVKITYLTATSITFDIQEYNETETPPLLGYTAEYDKDENYNVTDIHINRTWAMKVPYKIDKLESGTMYRIRFAAINKGGTGPYGAYHYFHTPDKSVPEPPSWIQEYTGPILIPADNKILKLKAPVHNGAPIDYYAVRYCLMEDNNECIEERIPPTTELKIDHLTPNTSYVVEMAAHNTVGNSTYVSFQIMLEEENPTAAAALLTQESIIGIAVVVVILCILLLDVILYFTMKKGLIASCILKKHKNSIASKQSRDKKGLLKDREKSAESLKRDDNGHKEFEYNKSTGVITGKHSAV